MSTALETLFPTGKEITINGQTLVIKPFKFGELSRVCKAADPILGTIAAAFRERTNQMSRISKILIESSDNAIDIMVISTKQPRAWIEDLDVDDALNLLIAVLEVNADFFIRKVLPNLNREMERMAVDPKTQDGSTQ